MVLKGQGWEGIPLSLGAALEFGDSSAWKS